MQLSKYKIVSSISLSDKRCLVLYDSYPEPGKKYLEILGKELFLLDKNGDFVWNINIPIGNNTQGIDGTLKQNYGLLDDDRLVNLYTENDKILVRSIEDMIFEVDIETGKATFQRWTR